MKEDILNQFRALGTEDKLETLCRLWDEVAAELAARPLTEAEQRFLDQRLRDIDSDDRPVRSWSEVQSELFANR